MDDTPKLLSLASVESAKTFVRALDISGLPRARALARSPLSAPLHALLPSATGPADAMAPQPTTGTDNLDVKSGVQQAWLVGSQIVSFDKDVTPERRTAALQSGLLAQLAATKKYPFHDDPDTARGWQATYISTLTSIGWILQGGEVSSNTAGQSNVAVDKIVLQIVGTLLPGGTALALAQRVIEALKNMNDSDPFIALYASRTVEQNSVDFSMSLAAGTDAGFLVSALEYAIDVRVAHSQALFFKWDSTDASLSYRRYDLSLDDATYAAVAAAISDKLKDYVQTYVSKIDI